MPQLLVGGANSCGGLVLVDESAEQVATLAAIGRTQRHRVAAMGREEVERAVRPVLVVVAAVDAEQVLEVAAAEGEDPVETLSAERADPALGVGVRVRRLDGRADHPEALGAKDLVEGVAELGVAIMDEKPERLLADELRACWATSRRPDSECRRRTRSVASPAR